MHTKPSSESTQAPLFQLVLTFPGVRGRVAAMAGPSSAAPGLAYDPAKHQACLFATCMLMMNCVCFCTSPLSLFCLQVLNRCLGFPRCLFHRWVRCTAAPEAFTPQTSLQDTDR